MIIHKNIRSGVITIAEGRNNRDYTELYRSSDKREIIKFIERKF
jgi:hypothetical protein